MKASTVKWYCYFRIDYIVLFADFNRGKNSSISIRRQRIEALRRCTNNFSHICCVEWKRTSKNLFQRKWNKSFVSTWPSSRSSTTSWSLQRTIRNWAKASKAVSTDSSILSWNWKSAAIIRRSFALLIIFPTTLRDDFRWASFVDAIYASGR